MSKKGSEIVRQLSEATSEAERQRNEMSSASVTADEKLTHLRKHTMRVGQLVGIIRQLYGAMDERVGRLRDKLNTADDLCRTVPAEIDDLRSALAGESRPNLASTDSDSRAPQLVGATVGTPSPAKAAPNSTNVPALASATESNAADSLAHVVRRNQKLNQWLRETLGEAAEQPEETKR